MRTMAVDGKHGVGREAEVPGVYQEVGCGIVSLLETRRRGQSALLQAGYAVTAAVSPETKGEWKRAKMELDWISTRVLSGSIRSPELISDRLLKVTLGLGGRARAVAFVVG